MGFYYPRTGKGRKMARNKRQKSSLGNMSEGLFVGPRRRIHVAGWVPAVERALVGLDIVVIPSTCREGAAHARSSSRSASGCRSSRRTSGKPGVAAGRRRRAAVRTRRSRAAGRGAPGPRERRRAPPPSGHGRLRGPAPLRLGHGGGRQPSSGRPRGTVMEPTRSTCFWCGHAERPQVPCSSSRSAAPAAASRLAVVDRDLPRDDTVRPDPLGAPTGSRCQRPREAPSCGSVHLRFGVRRCRGSGLAGFGAAVSREPTRVLVSGHRPSGEHPEQRLPLGRIAPRKISVSADVRSGGLRVRSPAAVR